MGELCPLKFMKWICLIFSKENILRKPYGIVRAYKTMIHKTDANNCLVMKKKQKVFMYMVMGCFIAILLLIFICNRLICSNAEGKLYTEVDSIPQSEVGLLLGTTPQTRIGERENMFFKYRIDATEELYKAGKIQFILISGDENSLDGINEPECMRDSLVARGIPKNVIFLDGKGYRTLDSVVRMRTVYGVRIFTIISQKFHNERALYLAEHLGLDVENIQAYNAKDPTSAMSMMTYIREYFARVKMFLDIWMDKQPSSLKD